MDRVPRVLLCAPGWRVVYADEQSAHDGKVSVANAEQPGSPRGGPGLRAGSDAEIRWRPGDLSSSTSDGGAPARQSTVTAVLGVVGHVYDNVSSQHGRQTAVALWGLDGHIFEFRAVVTDVDSFGLLLSSLQRVGESEWLSALPADVVRPSDHGAAVSAMLLGVPLPPGFEPGAIRTVGLVKDRYQFGAMVAGTVACTWFKHWSEARRHADAVGASSAIDAMSTAKDWPILKEMAESGAYPWVIEQLAEAMPSGQRYGRPLEDDVNSGLGCAALGVALSSHAPA